jgi:Fe2+ transport system protein FeoA
MLRIRLIGLIAIISLFVIGCANSSAALAQGVVKEVQFAAPALNRVISNSMERLLVKRLAEKGFLEGLEIKAAERDLLGPALIKSMANEGETAIPATLLRDIPAASPAIEVELLSGKVKVNASFLLGPIKISGGEINIFKVAGFAGGVIVVCDVIRVAVTSATEECIRAYVRKNIMSEDQSLPH